jgi:hypothetical protein
MTEDHSQTSDSVPPRTLFSAAAGGLAGLMLAAAVVVMALHKIITIRLDSVDRGALLFSGLAAFGTGALCGFLATLRRNAGFAIGVGAVLVILLGTLMPQEGRNIQKPPATFRNAVRTQICNEQAKMYALAAFLAFLSITSQAGACGNGSLVDGRRVLQFSIGDLLYLFVPVAAYFGSLNLLLKQ